MLGRPASSTIDGPAGLIEVVIEDPATPPVGLAVIAHPHPLMGGTMDNKVVHTLVRAFVLQGWRAVRFNFRGVGQSESAWDEGRGETADMLAVLAHHQTDPAMRGLPVALAGFSFGGYVAAQAYARLAQVAANQPAVRRRRATGQRAAMGSPARPAGYGGAGHGPFLSWPVGPAARYRAAPFACFCLMWSA
jgi:alpha/beta superfamily hydrolase